MKKKVPSVTMNVLIKTSTLFKSIKTNYQENFSRKLIFKIKVFYPSEIFNQFSLIHESITHILTVKIVFFPAQTSTRTHAPTVLHGSLVRMRLITIPNIVSKNAHCLSGLNVNIKKEKENWIHAGPYKH